MADGVNDVRAKASEEADGDGDTAVHEVEEPLIRSKRGHDSSRSKAGAVVSSNIGHSRTSADGNSRLSREKGYASKTKHRVSAASVSPPSPLREPNSSYAE